MLCYRLLFLVLFFSLFFVAYYPHCRRRTSVRQSARQYWLSVPEPSVLGLGRIAQRSSGVNGCVCGKAETMEGELLYSGLIKLFQREFCNGTNRFSRHNFLQGDGGMKVTLLLNCASGNQVETLIGFLGFRLWNGNFWAFSCIVALPSFGHPLFLLPKKVRSFNKGQNLMEMFRASNLVLTTKTRVIFFHLCHATEEEEEIKRWSLLQRGTLI